MGSEMQPQIIRAQKSKQILIIEINKDYLYSIVTPLLKFFQLFKCHKQKIKNK
jgi:hypothetical protein